MVAYCAFFTALAPPTPPAPPSLNSVSERSPVVMYKDAHFLLAAAWCVIVWVYHSSFTQPSAAGHLSYFQSLAVTQIAAVNSLVHVYVFLYLYQHILEKIPRSRIASKGQISFKFSPTVYESTYLFTVLSA